MQMTDIRSEIQSKASTAITTIVIICAVLSFETTTGADWNCIPYFIMKSVTSLVFESSTLHFIRFKSFFFKLSINFSKVTLVYDFYNVT